MSRIQWETSQCQYAKTRPVRTRLTGKVCRVCGVRQDLFSENGCCIQDGFSKPKPMSSGQKLLIFKEDLVDILENRAQIPGIGMLRDFKNLVNEITFSLTLEKELRLISFKEIVFLLNLLKTLSYLEIPIKLQRRTDSTRTLTKNQVNAKLSQPKN